MRWPTSTPGRTGWVDDVSQIGLRRDIADDEAPFVHLLVLDETGHEAANRIDLRLRDARHVQRNLAPQDRFYPLRVKLPFKRAHSFRLEVEGFAPYDREPNHFVGLRVRRWWWPIDLPEIKVWRDNSNEQGAQTFVSDEDKPYAHARIGVLAETGGVPQTDPREDASAAMMREVWRTEGPKLEGGPHVEHVEKPMSVTRMGRAIPRVAEDTSDLSFSAPVPGGRSVPAQAKSTGRETGIHQFTAVADMLDRLCETKEIDDWRVVPAQGRAIAPVGHWQAWAFPEEQRERQRSLPWHLPRPAGEERRPRSSPHRVDRRGACRGADGGGDRHGASRGSRRQPAEGALLLRGRPTRPASRRWDRQTTRPLRR